MIHVRKNVPRLFPSKTGNLNWKGTGFRSAILAAMMNKKLLLSAVRYVKAKAPESFLN